MSNWEATKEALEPLVTSPPLTEKHLSRPPFRFIHDLITNITQNHGTFKDIFPADLLDGGQVDSKEKKVQYLEILVKAVEGILGKTLEVNPKKVVTGSEVEATNIFLQQVAEAVKLSTGSAFSSHPPPPPPPPAHDEEHVPPPPPPPAPSASTHSSAKKFKAPNPRLDAFKFKLTKLTEEFSSKIANFGFQLSPESLPANRMTADINSMAKDFQDTTETDASKMPEAALATAIQRQMEAIFQVSALIDDNNLLCNQLVEEMMSGLN